MTCPVTILTTLMICVCISASLGASGTADRRAVIDAEKYLDRSLGDCGFQKAIDAAGGAGGGIVQLPPGRFTMERYLYLRSGVMLKGKGRRTILATGRSETLAALETDAPQGVSEVRLTSRPGGLKPGMLVFLWPDSEGERRGETLYYKVKEIRERTILIDKPNKHALLLKNRPHVSWGLHTYTTAPLVKGSREIKVAHPELLAPGHAVKLTGKGDMWNHHFNVVTDIEGDTLALERPLTIEGKESLVQHAFAMITADGEKNIGVSDLVIEGWIGRENPRWVGLDFCLGAIHTARCDDIEIRNVEVRKWHSDGVSIQAGKNALIDNCATINCYGWGFHAGTTFTNAEFTNLKSIGSGRDGFYYCWRCKNVNVRNSLIAESRGSGIGGMGDPGDRELTVEGNTIERNGRAGILINGGGEDSQSVIRNNTIRDNSRAKRGDWAGIAIYPSGEKAQGYLIEGNTIASTLPDPTQLIGIEERNGDPVKAEVWSAGEKVTRERIADRNTIRGNKFNGHSTSDIVLAGPRSTATDNGEAKVISKRLTSPD